MQERASHDTCPGDSAVSLREVAKVFTQRQRAETLRGLMSNLIRPKKRRIAALDGVTLSVGRGEFVAYAGPNGAGKSTTIKLISGMLAPDAGEISVLDAPPWRAPGVPPGRERIALMRRVGILFGNRTELWRDHPVAASFEWKRAVWDLAKPDFARAREELIELLDLGPLLQTFSRELSLGQRMRCDLAMMLLHEPELILLDEPTLGLDVLAKRRMIEFLKQYNEKRGATIVVTSHDMDDLEEMARRIVLLAEGRVAFDGAFQEFRRFVGESLPLEQAVAELYVKLAQKMVE